MSSILLESPSLSPLSVLVSSTIFSLAFLKTDELDIEASISDDVDGEFADAQEDMWLVFFSGLQLWDGF